jgi:hypothetical protein
MKLELSSFKLLSKKELKEYLLEISEFMELPFEEYWSEKDDVLSKQINYPKILSSDAIFKIKEITPIVGNYLLITENIDGITHYRIREIVK